MKIGTVVFAVFLILVASFAGLGFLAKQTNDLAEENRILKQRAAELEQNLDQATQENVRLVGEIVTLRNELNQVQTQLDQAKTNANNLENALNQVVIEREQAWKEIKTLNVRLVEIQEKSNIEIRKAQEVCKLDNAGVTLPTAFAALVMTNLVIGLLANYQGKRSKLIQRMQKSNRQAPEGLVTVQMTRGQLEKYIKYQRRAQ